MSLGSGPAKRDSFAVPISGAVRISLPPRAAVNRSTRYRADELGTSELGALVCIENFGRPELRERFLQRLHTEIRRHAVGEPPGEDLAAEPVDDGDPVQKAAGHRDVAYVHRTRCSSGPAR